MKKHGENLKIAALRVIKITCKKSQAENGCKSCPYGIEAECIFKTIKFPSFIDVMDMPTKAYVKVGVK